MTEAVPADYAGPKRIVSGVQPTGDLHLGNYLGALVKFVRMQHEMETFLFIADMHALTEWPPPITQPGSTRRSPPSSLSRL